MEQDNELNSMISLSSGEEAIEAIKLAYKAGLPVLLWGNHGVGKSEILVEAANQLQISYIIRDLSIMEPTDLTGLPFIDKKTTMTSFAPPAFLPTSNEVAGLLIIEELNRAPRYMQTPCLQLLTQRVLNGYRLPTGWLPCASCNPNSELYNNDILDAALLSRFVNLNITPNVASWVKWALKNKIHPAIIDYVNSAEPFGSSRSSKDMSNPRSWAYASSILTTCEDRKNVDDHVLEALLAGVLSPFWTASFIAYYKTQFIDPILTPIQIIENYNNHKNTFKNLLKNNQIDKIRNILQKLELYLKEHKNDIASEKMKNIESCLSDVPFDIIQHSIKSFKEFCSNNSLKIII